MPSRATRRIVSTTVTALVAVSLAGVGLGSAAAAPAGQPACESVHPASKSAADIRKAVDTLTTCIAGLQKSADAAGRTSQVADEHYLTAKSAAAAAAQRSIAAQKVADAATAKALRSRARAAVVAANLARTSSADQAAGLLLDGGGATRVLYGVSRMSQLSVQSTQIFTDAKSDERTAKLLESRASAAAAAAQSAADRTKAAFEKAKRDATAAKDVVNNQRRRQQALQAELAALLPRPSVGSGSSFGRWLLVGPREPAGQRLRRREGDRLRPVADRRPVRLRRCRPERLGLLRPHDGRLRAPRGSGSAATAPPPSTTSRPARASSSPTRTASPATCCSTRTAAATCTTSRSTPGTAT